MTTKPPKFVQLRANRVINDHIEPAQHRDEVEFYSIYLGEPGDYQWLTDFESSDEALEAARLMVLAFRCEVDRSQFDMVLAEDRASAAVKADRAAREPSEVDMDEYRAMVAAMEQIDPATLPGLTVAQRCALGRFAKPTGGPAE